ncbi:MAG: hypothetical protein Q4E35_10370, partial [Eubacteriales bacterium]|nr:hypothetical protein [Eubacteriales bacterium]
PTENPTQPSAPETVTQYEWFMSLSAAEKDAFMDSFGSMEAFYQWLVTAQAEYESRQPEAIEIKPGETIDLSKLS